MTQPASMGLWQRLRAYSRGDGLRAQLLRGGVGSMAVKAGHAVLSFLLAVVLARMLGPEGYGVYAFVLALTMLLAIPAQVGVPQLVVRETAKAQAAADWGQMRGLWRWGTAFVLLFSLAMLAATGLVLWLGADRMDEARRATLIAGLALIPLMALGNVRGAALRGLRHVVLGQLPESVLRPGILLLLVMAVVLLLPAGTLTPQAAMTLHAAAAAVAFFLGAWMLWAVCPKGVRDRSPRYEAAQWRNAAMPLALIAGLQLINRHTDIVMLGLLHDDEGVGIYRVIVQVATLVVFGQQAAIQVLQPHFARLYAQGDSEKLQRLVTTGTRVILFLALPPVALFAFFGGSLLSWVFGSDYSPGAAALAILAAGQLVNAGMGPAIALLNMTGHERDTMRGVGLAAVVNVTLNLILIPLFGIEGAAVATTVTVVIWNLLLRSAARRRLGVETLAFRPPRL